MGGRRSSPGQLREEALPSRDALGDSAQGKRHIHDKGCACAGVARRAATEVGQTGRSLLSSRASSFLQLENSFLPLKAHLCWGLGGGSWGRGSHSPALPVAQAPYRPTSSSSRSPARGRSRFQMSMVKSVLLLLKMEVSDDMRAAIITAIISPRRPGGGGHRDPPAGASSLRRSPNLESRVGGGGVGRGEEAGGRRSQEELGGP